MFSQPTTPAVNPFDQPGGPGPVTIREEGNSRWMPHPETGKLTRFTRASGWGGVIADETVLTEWKIAMAVLGVTKNHDLYALGNSEDMPTENMEFRKKGWWMPWADLGHKAMDRIGSMSGAHLGTAFHAWREQYEAGKITMKDIPREWRPHMEAFIRIHGASELTYDPDYVERLVLTLSLHNGVTGRLDNLRRDAFGQLIVDDTKTGKSAPMGLDEIAVQESIYAHAEYHWDPDNPLQVHGYVPAPEGIRLDAATITWIPIDDPEKSEIIPVDIGWGWEAAQAIAWVKGYLNRAKRKNNGLRLPLDVLLTGERPDDMDPPSVFDLAGRIGQCTTLAELSQVVMHAAGEDRWTPTLEKIALAQKKVIRNGGSVK